jgi:hypothetical protein
MMFNANHKKTVVLSCSVVDERLARKSAGFTRIVPLANLNIEDKRNKCKR